MSSWAFLGSCNDSFLNGIQEIVDSTPIRSTNRFKPPSLNPVFDQASETLKRPSPLPLLLVR
jgi:hypothetical protein